MTKAENAAQALREKVRRQILGAMELTGLTYAGLADRLDVSNASVSAVLSAKDGGRNMELNSMARIANALNAEWQIVLIVDGKQITGEQND